MQAGDLNHLVDIHRPPAPDARDSTGQPSGTYSLATSDVWAKIEPLTGREAIEAQRFSATASHRVTVRFFSGTADIRPYWRLIPRKNQGRAFHVEYARELEEDGFWIECLCSEVAVDDLVRE
jgi:SPP1 family predicted phage head-tail adaptor